jgi:hypothetical protein
MEKCGLQREPFILSYIPLVVNYYQLSISGHCFQTIGVLIAGRVFIRKVIVILFLILTFNYPACVCINTRSSMPGQL